MRAVLPQRDLERTEFFTDFLARDGLKHGVNLYAWDGADNIGDLRIWRSRGRPDFEAEDIDLLDALRPAFTAALRTGRTTETEAPPPLDAEVLRERFGLTARESEVAAAVAQGHTDARIARDLGLSFHTVRTHLRAVFAKVGVSNRATLVFRLAATSPVLAIPPRETRA